MCRGSWAMGILEKECTNIFINYINMYKFKYLFLFPG